MSATRSSPHTPRPPGIVAVAHTIAGLELAAALPADAVDFVEVRLDVLAPHPDALDTLLPRIAPRVILTARHPNEGGHNALPPERRRALFLQHLSRASLIDVELRSIDGMRRLIATARSQGAGLILSFHDFRSTPPLDRLRRIVSRAAPLRPDIVKIATRTDNLAQLCRLLELLATQRRQRLAVMGMGPYAAASRLVAARGGSALNYGYLDTPMVPGQWPANLLQERVRELGES